ncbi:MAG TPA: ATP--guanido phosphotransferase, partial [Clostridiales bacterium]|nr:ATP--guanido phosphotransferase [Clostridiales bacterium]
MSWYIEAGPQHDVVLSSRIRLARNFRDFPFPARSTPEDSKKVKDRARSLFTDMIFVDIPEIPVIDRQALVERHLISPELAAGKNSPAAFVSRDEGLSIMVNEEDHLRIQSMQAGLQLDTALRNAVAVDEFVGSSAEYAFRPDYGYLTGCPTNLGTGMRASVMMHLPAMTKTGVMDKTLEACSKLGMTVRGLYGEHSEASGFIFQVSN